MTAPSTGYAQIATTLLELKAIPAANRSPNFCLLIPEIGSWVYYNPTSTTTPDDIHCFLPDDGIGRWFVTNQLPYFAAATGAIATHTAEADPHTQYHRRDGVLIANQPNTSTPAFTARVVTGNGSNVGGFQVLTSGNAQAVSLGVDSNNRGVISPGASGLIIGGNSSQPISFFGGIPTVRPNAIASPGNNTADTRRAVSDVINALRILGAISP